MFVEEDIREIIKEKKVARHYGLQYNLLNIPFLKKVLLWKGFPNTVQFLISAFLIGLIILGWGLHAPEGVDQELFAKLNIVCLLIWGIWWPLMILTAVIFGRIWCMVCPLEFISRISEKTGHLLHIRQLPLNRSLRGGIVIVILYALIQLLAAGTNLHKVPSFTAVFLSALIILSVMTGLFFKNSAFCKGFCPVAMTLNAYSRGSMLAIRTSSEYKCTVCEDKKCIKPGSRGIFDTRSCPGYISPSKLKSNKDCFLCAQCIKSCSSGNIQFLIRWPFSKIDNREKSASWILTIFVMMDGGFVTGELAEQWPVFEKMFFAIPKLFSGFSGLQTYSGWIEGVWTLFIFPVILWTLLGAALKIARTENSITGAWRNYALKAVIIFSAGHMIKSFIKLTEWAAFLPYSAKDLRGMNNLKAFSSGLIQPQPVFSHVIVSIVSLMILAAAVYFSIRENYIVRTGSIQ